MWLGHSRAPPLGFTLLTFPKHQKPIPPNSTVNSSRRVTRQLSQWWDEEGVFGTALAVPKTRNKPINQERTPTRNRGDHPKKASSPTILPSIKPYPAAIKQSKGQNINSPCKYQRTYRFVRLAIARCYILGGWARLRRFRVNKMGSRNQKKTCQLAPRLIETNIAPTRRLDPKGKNSSSKPQFFQVS